MNKQSVPESKLKKELLHYLSENYSYKKRNILSSMGTEPLEISEWAYAKFIESNLGNPYLFPGTMQLEQKIVEMLGDLLHHKNAKGKVLSGGTESNITALWLARKLKPCAKTIVASEAVHFSITKAADLLNLNLKLIPLTDKFVMDTSYLKDIDQEDTVALIGIAGTTEFGTVEPISVLGKIAEQHDLFLHVDAAFGGFVIPFLKMMNFDVPDFDFSVKGVSSVAIDPHKMGLSTNGAGVLLLRQNWFDLISFNSEYLTVKRSRSLLGTRNSGSVAATYAAIRSMGMNGYKRVVKKCIENTKYLANILKERNIELLLDPVLNIVSIKIDNPVKIADKLKPRWIVGFNEKYSALRIVMMPHITKQVIDSFVIDLKESIDRT